jgi:hypothetical protein
MGLKQADIARYLKAAHKAGLHVSGFRVEPDGSVFISTSLADVSNSRNPCDALLETNHDVSFNRERH